MSRETENKDVNYDCARQRKDGRWEWTTGNVRTGIRAVGYCAGWIEWTQEMADRIGFALDYLRQRQNETDGPFREKFHRNGHATKEEAERCFYDFCLDHAGEQDWVPRGKCEFPGCGETAVKAFGMPREDSVIPFAFLCDAHRNRAGLEAAHPFEAGIQITHT